jgi:nucleoid-associated protein YgaU
VRRQAEELAEEASKKFGEVLQEQTPAAKPKPPSSPVSAADRERSLSLLFYWFDYSDHEYRGILRRLALEGAAKGWDPGTVGWLKRSSQEFQAIMQRLARAGGPGAKWDPVAEAHHRAVREQGRARDGTAPTATPSATAPGASDAPGTAIPALGAPGGPPGPPAAEAEPAGRPRRAEATEPAADNGQAVVEAPANSDAGSGAMAAAEPQEPSRSEPASKSADPAPPQPARPTEPAPLAAELAPDKGTPAPEREAREKRGEVLRLHEEEEDTSKPEVVIAEAKPSKDGPAEDAAREVRPGAATAPAEGGQKPAEERRAEDRVANNPAATPSEAGTSDQPSAATAATSRQRRASKIARPAEPEARLARPRQATKGERCQAAGAKVALPGWYVVKTGDTLWAIAERHYGAGARYRTIFLANRERLKRGPDLIMPCQQLYLPQHHRRGS